MPFLEKVGVIRDNAGVSGMSSNLLVVYPTLTSTATPSVLVGQLDFNWPTTGSKAYGVTIGLVDATSVTLIYAVASNSSISTLQVWMSVIDEAWSSILFTYSNIQHTGNIHLIFRDERYQKRYRIALRYRSG